VEYTILTGAASPLPIALLQQSTIEGGWITIPDCAVPVNGCTTDINLGVSKGLSISSVVLQLTNLGGSGLTVTKSKPPITGVLYANNPSTDFSEGEVIAPGNSTTATVTFEPGAPILNSDGIYSATWTLNTNDLNFGVHVLNFTGTVITNKTGPLLPNGNSLYQYLGCYQDLTNGRIEAKGYVNTGINSNGLCQNESYAAGFVFAGTEYSKSIYGSWMEFTDPIIVNECWVGNVIPPASVLAADSECDYTCSGDATQSCGGYGGFISLFYDSSRYFPETGVILGVPPGPEIKANVSSYQYYGCCRLSLPSVHLGITDRIRDRFSCGESLSGPGADFGDHPIAGNLCCVLLGLQVLRRRVFYTGELLHLLHFPFDENHLHLHF
jgi:hypothetical protein